MPPLKKPYIPNLLPIENLDWEQMARLIEGALLELGRFDGTLASMLNPDILLSPLRMNEAVLSSKIEGTQMTLTQALEYEVGTSTDREKTPDGREIINYRSALLNAEQGLYDSDRVINLTLIRMLHKNLMNNVRGGDKTPGQFRTEQNWIGKKGEPMEKARFIPPAPIIMHDYLENWTNFVNDNQPSPLVQLALIHAQFEIIHPFLDGNGRLGRMIIPLFMYQKNILKRPVFYISEYIDKNDREYRDRLLAITEAGDWMGWVLFFLRAVWEQAKINNNKAGTILKLYEEMKEEFRKATHSQYTQPALDAFFRYPVLTSTKFMEITELKNRITANNILRNLAKNSLIELKRPGAGRKPATYGLRRLITEVEYI